MENPKELEAIIRSLLISNPIVTKANRLESDYEDTEGRRFPFRQLGFGSFLDYLHSIPHVVKLEPSNSFNPNVLPIVTKNNSHIDQLVSKQRSTVPRRKKNGFRRGGYHGLGRGGAVPRRRPPANNPPPRFMPTTHKVPTTNDPDFMENVVWDVVKLVASSKPSGVHVSDIEKHIRDKYSNEHLSSNGIHCGQDLLSHASEMVERVNQKVYPNLSYSSEISNATKQQPASSGYTGIPAGMEEEFEDDIEQYDDYNNIDDDDDDDNHGVMKYDDAFFEKNEEETVSNYTIQLCTERLLNSKRNNQSATKGDEERISEDHESNLSKVMINNFRLILAKNPEGIWATQLQQKYREEFRVTLDPLELGYASAIMMASHLPNIFSYERVDQDWKLFDARLHDKRVAKVRTQADDKTGSCDDKYVPESIYRNVMNLVQQNPGGIKSTNFLSLFEREYRTTLDLEKLGFKQLEDFLGLFKDKITFTKSIGHYLLLPKHTTRSLYKPPTPDEELKLPVDIEFLGPDNVLRPNEVIPMQPLPEIDIDISNREKPLIEMVVRVAEVMTPSYFFLMLDSCYNELQNMMEDLEKFYNHEEANYHIMLPYLTENMFCVCKYEGLWHRAKITGLLPNSIIEIEYIDYGTPAKVKSFELRFLHKDFANLPSQAICAKLLGIHPVGRRTKWPKEACLEFLRIVTEKRLYAHVYSIGSRTRKEPRTQIDIILYDTCSAKEIICNEYLFNKGLAEYTAAKSESNLEENSQTLNQNSSSSSQRKSPLSGGTLEENTHTLNQNSSSSSQLNPPTTQTKGQKRSPTVPPGFENVACSNSTEGQYPMQPTLQQHYHHTNNYLFAPTNNSLKEFQQYLLPTPHTLNTQQMYFQGNNLNGNWPYLPYIPINPNYTPANNPSTAHLPPTHPYFPSLSTSQYYYQSQANSYPLNVNVSVQNVQSYNSGIHNTLGKIPGFSGDLCTPTPAASHLSTPTPAASRTLSSQQNIELKEITEPDLQYSIAKTALSELANQINQLQITANILAPLKPLNTESSTMLKLECDVPADTKNVLNLNESVEERERNLEHLQMAANTLPSLKPLNTESSTMLELECDVPADTKNVLNLTESVEERERNFEHLQMTANTLSSLKPLNTESSTMLELECNESADLRNVLNLTDSVEKKESDFELDKLNEKTSNEKSLKSQMLSSPRLSFSLSTSGKFLSMEDIPECISVKENGQVTKPNETTNEIPDSWEDIDPDDTPSKAENFSENLNNILGSTHIEEKYTEPNEESSNSLVLKTNKINSHNNLFQTTSLADTVNWKNLFNPDITSNIESNKKHNNITPYIENKCLKRSTKIELVEKIDFNDKIFHVIWVKSKYAVLAKEFYTQFVKIPFHIIEKVAQSINKEFPKISKKDQQELFLELDKNTLHCKTVQKDVIKVGCTLISYISDIPIVFSALKHEADPKLLEIFKEWEVNSKTT